MMKVGRWQEQLPAGWEVARMLSPNLEPLCVTGPAAGDPVDHGQGGFPTTSFDHSQAGFAPDLVWPPGGIRAEAGAYQLA